ncbi:MAG: methylmalonyl-CoA epimerase [Actinobacteria bacterium]|nr:methylmalonyl-CoA epimerase [Actinomycetota bacterium]MCL6094286.1 methylmalonyl-CoA epimerase [Actinomycetota bacterium]
MSKPLLTEIDHIAIAVSDLESAISWYETMFGATVTHREMVTRDGVEEALLAVADSYIQLISPRQRDSSVAKFLERHGEGIHHVGYRVDNVESTLEHLREAGARLIDTTGRPGSRGTTVAFVHPRGSFGTLIELVEVH